MQLYNTRTQKKEEFIPHEAGKVKMYTTMHTSATCARTSWRICWKKLCATSAMT